MKQYEFLKLENQLCFPLYACAKEVVRKYQPFLEEIGLTYTQYVTMMVLWERREMHMKELGETLYLDSGTLTPVLKKLEKTGLLQRRRDPADERSLMIEITPEGLLLREKAVDIPVKMGECLALTPEELEGMRALLQKVLGRLHP